MKSRSQKIMIWLFAALLTGSCEKVIDINLNDSDPKMVISAEIADQSFCFVKLTRSVNFDASNVFPAVSGANILVSDNLGNSEILTEDSLGYYSGKSLRGVSGRTYTIEISDGVKTLKAMSYMPPPVEIDTMVVLYNSGMMGNKRQVEVHYRDPAGVRNFYRLVKVINSDQKSSIIFNNDDLRDGEILRTSLSIRGSNDGSGVQSGDTVTARLMTIDENVFQFFRTFKQVESGGGFSAASPTNPITNFNDGALGYFSAHSMREKQIIVP